MKRIRERVSGDHSSNITKSYGTVTVRDAEPAWDSGKPIRRISVSARCGNGTQALLTMGDVDDLIGALLELKEEPGV